MAKDVVRALALCKRACDGGNLNGCADLGTLYANGTGVAKDEYVPSPVQAGMRRW